MTAQGLKLSELLEMNLRTVRAYLLKEDFQRFWNYTYPAWAEKFLDRWCFRTMRSNIEPMKNIAKMLRRHRELILNWFRANKQFNNGIVEGLNLNDSRREAILAPGRGATVFGSKRFRKEQCRPDRRLVRLPVSLPPTFYAQITLRVGWPCNYNTVTGGLVLSPSPPRIAPSQLRLVE